MKKLILLCLFNVIIINYIFGFSSENYISPEEAVAGDTILWNGLEYEVIEHNGLLWLDRNLGATRSAQSHNDNQAYGDLYQWGRLTDGHEKRTSSTTEEVSSTDIPGHDSFIIRYVIPNTRRNYWREPKNTELWQGVDGINNPCPPGWRIPTGEELNTERLTWTTTPHNSPLKWVHGGLRNTLGTISGWGSGVVWSSSVVFPNWDNDENVYIVQALEYDLTDNAINEYGTALGASVRCVKDIGEPEEVVIDYVEPEDAVDGDYILWKGLEYQVIERNGLLWLDRNLGASRVPISPRDRYGYGDLYQWGRLTDGHEKRTLNITHTLSSTDVPGHSNFIYGYHWRVPRNEELWQGVDGINNPCPPGWRIPTSEELNTERFTWTPDNAFGAFESPLKWTVGGFRANDTKFYMVGNSGGVWTSDIVFPEGSVNVYAAQRISYGMTYSSIAGIGTGYGVSVRCVKDIVEISEPPETIHYDFKLHLKVNNENYGYVSGNIITDIITDATHKEEKTKPIILITKNNNRVKINAYHYSGYEFVGWTKNDKIFSRESENIFYIYEDMELTANFRPLMITRFRIWLRELFKN